MSQQSHILPDCDWQHITFTMPHLLWPFFNNNWPLLNTLFRAATRAAMLGGPANRAWRSVSSAPCIPMADNSTSITRTFICPSPVAAADIKHSIWRDIFFRKARRGENLARGGHPPAAPLATTLINPGSLPGLRVYPR